MHLKVFSLTYSDDLHASILQAACRSNGIILRFTIGQQDQEKRCSWPCACLWPHVLLHDMEQRLAWEMDAGLPTYRHTIVYCVLYGLKHRQQRRSIGWLPVNVFPPLYLKFLTASKSCSLVVKLLRCHSVRGSPLYWVRPGRKYKYLTRLYYFLWPLVKVNK